MPLASKRYFCQMSYKIIQEGEFDYIEEGSGENLLLLHGLFGALSNWHTVIEQFKTKYRVIIPLLPIYTMPVKKAGIEGLLQFVERFIEFKNLKNLHVIGNSLGGHIGVVYTVKYPENVKSLVLTGSSGLYENSMGSSFPRRSNREFVKEKVGYTFYDPAFATEDLVDYVLETTSDIGKCLRMVAVAKSAQRNNVMEDLAKITAPTLLIWGLNDTITPPFVAHEFNKYIPGSDLKFIDKCGHAPMMEHPEYFNQLLIDFYSTKC